MGRRRLAGAAKGLLRFGPPPDQFGDHGIGGGHANGIANAFLQRHPGCQRDSFLPGELLEARLHGIEPGLTTE